MEFIEFIRKLCLIIFWSRENLFFFVCECLGRGYISLIFFFNLSNVLLEFQNNGQAFIQSKNIWPYWKVNAPHLPSIQYWCVCICMCAHSRWCACGGWGGCMCRPVIWWHLQALPMQQCGCHYGSLHCIVSFIFFPRNAISSLAVSLHMGSLHPAVVFIITAVFFFFLFHSVPLVVLDRLKLL